MIKAQKTFNRTSRFSLDKLDKFKGCVEQAMKEFEIAQPSEKAKKDFDAYVAPLKDLVIANGNQSQRFSRRSTNCSTQS